MPSASVLVIELMPLSLMRMFRIHSSSSVPCCVSESPNVTLTSPTVTVPLAIPALRAALMALTREGLRVRFGRGRRPRCMYSSGSSSPAQPIAQVRLSAAESFMPPAPFTISSALHAR